MKLKKPKRHQIFFIAALIPLLAAAVWCEITLHRSAVERESVQFDISHVNSITYGLLSVKAWEGNIRAIVSHQIDDFDLSREQEKSLEKLVSNVLDSLLTQADNMLENSDTTFKKKLQKFAINLLVDFDALRKQVPQFSETIVDQLTEPENKKRFKKVARQKLDKYFAETYDDNDSIRYQKLLNKYDTGNRTDFNDKTEKITSSLQQRTYRLTYAVLGIMVFFLLMWAVVYKHPELRRILFVMTVLLALSALITGITTPMMEIDARIKQIDFVLLKQHVRFENQVLFYQSKSILQVVKILLKTGKADSILVGILILAFSIILPLSKLISTEFYLEGKPKLRNNKFFHWLAIKSGKWSMADVMVIAITMTYVGIKGIVDNQLEVLNIESDSLNSITTNLTSLLPGFVLFLSFVVFGLILSVILQRITPDEK